MSDRERGRSRSRERSLGARDRNAGRDGGRDRDRAIGDGLGTKRRVCASSLCLIGCSYLHQSIMYRVREVLSKNKCNLWADVNALMRCLVLFVRMVSQDDASRDGIAHDSDMAPKEQEERGAGSSGAAAGVGSTLRTTPPLPHIPPPALPGSKAWVDQAALAQRAEEKKGPVANGEGRSSSGDDKRGSELPVTRPAIAFRLGAGGANGPPKGAVTDGVVVREGDAEGGKHGTDGQVGNGAWSGWHDSSGQQAGAAGVAAADGGGNVREGGEEQGKAGVESGEEIQRKLREQALKSMLLARAKGAGASTGAPVVCWPIFPGTLTVWVWVSVCSVGSTDMFAHMGFALVCVSRACRCARGDVLTI